MVKYDGKKAKLKIHLFSFGLLLSSVIAQADAQNIPNDSQVKNNPCEEKKDNDAEYIKCLQDGNHRSPTNPGVPPIIIPSEKMETHFEKQGQDQQQ